MRTALVLALMCTVVFLLTVGVAIGLALRTLGEATRGLTP
jgi:hypothetical protein